VPGCETIACVVRELFNPDGTLDSRESRFFITSLKLDEVSPGALLQKTRDHWQVENNLHWMKDRYWEEDKHYIKWSGKVFITLTNMAVSLLYSMHGSDDPLRATAEDMQFEPQRMLQMLGFQTE